MARYTALVAYVTTCILYVGDYATETNNYTFRSNVGASSPTDKLVLGGWIGWTITFSRAGSFPLFF